MSIQKSESDKGFRGYIFSRSINNNFIPQRVQNLVIKDFASRKKLFFKLSSTEYIMENCFHMLKALVKEIKFINSYSFIFSPRPGTPASKLEAVDKEVAKQRLIDIQKVLESHQMNKNKSLIGMSIEVLVENKLNYH